LVGEGGGSGWVGAGAKNYLSERAGSGECKRADDRVRSGCGWDSWCEFLDHRLVIDAEVGHGYQAWLN